MKDSNSNPTQLGTHARLLISEWQALSSLIRRQSHQSETTKTEAQAGGKPQILSGEVVNDALAGCYGSFIKMQLHAFGLIQQYRFEIAVQEDSQFKEAREELAEHVVRKPSISEDKLKKLSIIEMTNLQSELNQLCQTQTAEWDELHGRACQTTQQALAQQKIQLNEFETQELFENIAQSDLDNRFIELKLTFDKNQKQAYGMSDYLKQKCQLVIVNFLSRHQKPHSDSEVIPIIKTLSKVFTEIQTEEKTLLQKQQQEVDEILIKKIS